MRKYYQAALAVTAVVSLISLLVYRHEYNKLRYVLEVFNYFGKPGPRRADVNCTNFSSSSNTFNTRFDKPIPSWQRLEDDLYIYSAYTINDKEIRAIGLGTIHSVLNIQCLVFFESEREPILGSLKFLPIGSTSGVLNRGENRRYGGYHFICTYTNNKDPIGITFVTKSNKYLPYAPIFPIKVQPQSLSHNGIGVCVMQSPMKTIQSIDMIGFISFHALIGMDNFIIYDFGISNEFNIRLRDIADEVSSFLKFTYTVVPWNFPFMEINQNVIKEIMEVDCLYRTYNNVAYAISLSWNEYVVLKYHRTVIDLMADLKEIKLTVDRYMLKTTIFCMQQIDNKHYANSTLMMLRKTKSDSSILEDRPIYIHKPHITLQKNAHMYTKEMRKDLITVNQYKYCGQITENQEREESAILRFALDIENSPILKRYLGL